MTVRTNIKEVFDSLKTNGFDIVLSESYCSGPQSRPLKHTQRGWIRAAVENDDIMMDDINGEGSAEVSWIFGPQDKIVSLASSIVSTFTKKGYIIEWNKRMGGKITAVIEIDDLPTSFLDKWIGNKEDEDEDEDEFIEERVDPDADVIFNKDDDEKSIFSTDEEEDEEDEDDDAKSEPVIDPSSEDDDAKSEPDIDPSSEEDTICPEGCVCVNCEAERND